MSKKGYTLLELIVLVVIVITIGFIFIIALANIDISISNHADNHSQVEIIDQDQEQFYNDMLENNY